LQGNYETHDDSNRPRDVTAEYSRPGIHSEATPWASGTPGAACCSKRTSSTIAGGITSEAGNRRSVGRIRSATTCTENIRIYDNEFQCQIYPNTLAIVEHLEGLTFERNTWFTIAQAKPFRVGAGENQREVSFEQWVAASGEKDAEFQKIDYPDSGSSIENYLRKLGYRGTDEELYARFFAEARKMRRGAWRTEFTTREINEYFRAGFGMGRLPLDKLPPVECGTFEPTFSYRR